MNILCFKNYFNLKISQTFNIIKDKFSNRDNDQQYKTLNFL